LNDFRKHFFPDSEYVEAPDYSAQVVHSEETRKQKIFDRLKRTEGMLKDKLTANWHSVRKAFLDLDFDYDGFITAQDIGRFFGQEGSAIEFTDL